MGSSRRRDKKLSFAATLAVAVLIAVPYFAPCGCAKKEPVETATLDGAKIVSRTAGRYFETYDGSAWRRHLVKGFDIGSSVPNHWPGELAISKDTYGRWFEQIGESNANTILVYTLMMPWFYEALDEYNRNNPERRLWLLQQIWPEEPEDVFDLYDKARLEQYVEEIELDLDALNGNASVPRRDGLAWGDYRTDAMPYIVGIIVGREILFEEAEATNEENPEVSSYDGRYVSAVGGANPTEAWCARMADQAADRARSEYDWLVPVGYASWPTLDPMVHPTEFTPGGIKEKEADDSQVLDPNHIQPGDEAKAGIFATYQIYPYYPEFMYREPAYAEYEDEYGTLRYGGYLRHFMSIHPSYPAVIGEVGLSTSVGVAHEHPEGLSHGGITEQEQGEGVSRMVEAAVREGYAGACVFEWQDEWSKKNWVTQPYMVPYDRHVHWHNLMDPEQNFGVLAMEPDHVPFSRRGALFESEDGGGLEGIYMDHDAACLYLEIDLEGASSLGPQGDAALELLVGIDTVSGDHGTTRLPVDGLPDLPTGVEFLLRLKAGDGYLQVRPDYDKSTSDFSAAPSSEPVFVDVTYIVNRAQVSREDGTYFPAIELNASSLEYGDFTVDSAGYDSSATWYVSGDSVFVRLPWTMINVSDPSSRTVILDPRRGIPPGPAGIQAVALGGLRTAKTEGVRVYAAVTENGSLEHYAPRGGDSFGEDPPSYLWKGWEEAAYGQRLKESHGRIADAFESLETLVPE